MTVRDLTILGCSSQQPTRYRNHGAYLLRWNNEGFLFDPGEGTQRQFIFAEIAPTCVTRIFVSHFHGDHCLGLGSMLMRLNLDHVEHEIHCYYPASGKVYFDRLRYGTAYHEHIKVIEHPVSEEGLVEERDGFRIEAYFLDHGIDNIAWRIKEDDTRKFDASALASYEIKGPMVKTLIQKGQIETAAGLVTLDHVSSVKKGDVFAIVTDTRLCKGAKEAAKQASLLVCESTYLDEHRDLAWRHYHMTASQAAKLAQEADAKELVLTHFSARYPFIEPFETEARQIFPNTNAAEDFKRFEFKRS